KKYKYTQQMKSLFRIFLKKSAFLFITRAFLVHKSAFFPRKVKTTPIFSPKSRVTEKPQYEKTQIYTQKGVLFTIMHKNTRKNTKKHTLFTKIYVF
ncbi:MAG: hypothetical protein ACYS1A_13790, partial [Planctomycetota bacterium]